MHLRQTSIYASVLAGGIAVYYNYLSPSSNASSSALNSMQRFLSSAPFFVPKHPSRLFSQAIPKTTSIGKAIGENEYSLQFPPSFSASSLHQVSIASNEPCEDRHSENIYRISSNAGKEVLVGIFGVFDGHSGNECSETLRKFLPGYISQAIQYNQGSSIPTALESAFSRLDSEMLSVALDGRYNRLEEAVTPALAGSVGLVACLLDNHLFVANTGDVRAVLGRLDNSNDKYSAIDLSKDHNADNEEEVKRMLAEHPDESKEVLLYRKRVLGGLMPTRAFGDASYKWTRAQIENLSKSIKIPNDLLSNGNGHLAQRIRAISASKTPPYVTAKPEVAEFKLDTNDKFIIIASDGLWDEISSAEAVDIVSEYLATDEKVKQSINAASYLARRAFESHAKSAGSSADEYLGQLLAIPPPYSRRYRDDVTVSIVFLEEPHSEQLQETTNKLGEQKVPDETFSFVSSQTQFKSKI